MSSHAKELRKIRENAGRIIEKFEVFAAGKRSEEDFLLEVGPLGKECGALGIVFVARDGAVEMKVDEG